MTESILYANVRDKVVVESFIFVINVIIQQYARPTVPCFTRTAIYRKTEEVSPALPSSIISDNPNFCNLNACKKCYVNTSYC